MTVQFIDHSTPNAPTLTRNAGSLSSLLTATLVDGFGLVQLDSLVVAGGIATATRAAGHSAVVGSNQVVVGASPAGLNGVKRVLTANSNTFTYDATGIPDQTATGTITTRVAPLGWTKPYGGSNVEVFRSAVGGAQAFVRVDDTGLTNARARGYESMSDANTGVNPFPSLAQVAGSGVHWLKSGHSDSQTVKWGIVGDGRTFYLFIQSQLGRYGSPLDKSYGAHLAFGDIDSLVPGDAYSGFIQGPPLDPNTSSPTSWTADIDWTRATGSSESVGTYLERAYTGLGVSIQAQRRNVAPALSATADQRSGQSDLLQYPNGADGGLFVNRIALTEPSSRTLRGYLRGIWVTPQAIGPTVFSEFETLVSVAGLPSRTLRAVNTAVGVFFVDCTGPW